MASRIDFSIFDGLEDLTGNPQQSGNLFLPQSPNPDVVEIPKPQSRKRRRDPEAEEVKQPGAAKAAKINDKPSKRPSTYSEVKIDRNLFVSMDRKAIAKCLPMAIETGDFNPNQPTLTALDSNWKKINPDLPSIKERLKDKNVDAVLAAFTLTLLRNCNKQTLADLEISDIQTFFANKQNVRFAKIYKTGFLLLSPWLLSSFPSSQEISKIYTDFNLQSPLSKRDSKNQNKYKEKKLPSFTLGESGPSTPLLLQFTSQSPYPIPATPSVKPRALALQPQIPHTTPEAKPMPASVSALQSASFTTDKQDRRFLANELSGYVNLLRKSQVDTTSIIKAALTTLNIFISPQLSSALISSPPLVASFTDHLSPLHSLGPYFATSPLTSAPMIDRTGSVKPASYPIKPDSRLSEHPELPLLLHSSSASTSLSNQNHSAGSLSSLESSPPILQSTPASTLLPSPGLLPASSSFTTLSPPNSSSPASPLVAHSLYGRQHIGANHSNPQYPPPAIARR